MATLHISSWYSYCGNCRQQTLWNEGGHAEISGYGATGEPGCGATWDKVAFDYFFLDESGDPRENNDWYPDWMKALPLV
jgi:hypothetical protein